MNCSQYAILHEWVSPDESLIRKRPLFKGRSLSTENVLPRIIVYDSNVAGVIYRLSPSHGLLCILCLLDRWRGAQDGAITTAMSPDCLAPATS